MLREETEGASRGRVASRPRRAPRRQTRVLDERRRMCVAQRRARVARDGRDHSCVRVAAASARGEQLGRGATRPRVLDERRRMCVARRRARVAREGRERTRVSCAGGCSTSGDACASRKDERASRETGENTRVRWAEASARGEQLGRGATRPWGARPDGRRGCSTSGDACASRNDERASRETGENTRVRCVEAGARGEQLGRVATRLCEVTRVRREETKVHGERTSV